MAPGDDTVLIPRTTAPRFWEPDPQYEPPDERPRKAAWTLVLLSGLVLALVAGAAFMFGVGRADSEPEVIVQTEYVTPEPETVLVTPKRHVATVTATPRVSVKPGPTMVRTVPGPTVYRTAKPKISIKPGPTVTACFETGDPIECP